MPKKLELRQNEYSEIKRSATFYTRTMFWDYTINIWGHGPNLLEHA